MRLLPLCALVLLAGCDASGLGGVTFRTDATAYRPGDTVTVRLENESGGEVGYNLCFSTLQHSDDGRWLDVDRGGTGDAVFCTSILLGLEPGDSVESQLTVPAGAEAGEYRVQTSVEVDGESRRATTNAFSVG